MCVTWFRLLPAGGSAANLSGSKSCHVYKPSVPFSLDVLSVLVISVSGMVSMYRGHCKTCFSRELHPHTCRLFPEQGAEVVVKGTAGGVCPHALLLFPASRKVMCHSEQKRQTTGSRG